MTRAVETPDTRLHWRPPRCSSASRFPFAFRLNIYRLLHLDARSAQSSVILIPLSLPFHSSIQDSYAPTVELGNFFHQSHGIPFSLFWCAYMFLEAKEVDLMYVLSRCIFLIGCSNCFSCWKLALPVLIVGCAIYFSEGQTKITGCARVLEVGSSKEIHCSLIRNSLCTYLKSPLPRISSSGALGHLFLGYYLESPGIWGPQQILVSV